VGQSWTGRDLGFYTVQILDNITTCLSDPKTIEIVDGTILPVIDLELDAPMTVCDGTRPDGQLSASVEGETSGYIFDWFDGTTVTATPDFTGPVYAGLAAGDYTLRVTRASTGCVSTAPAVVEDATITPPSPEALVVQHQLSCISFIGQVTSSVNGSISGYTFEWFAGSDGSGAPIGILPDLTGLDAGIYSVRATDRITGCVSDPVAVEVLDQRLDPEFEFELVAAVCETLTGSATLLQTNDVRISEVLWTDQDTGEQLIGLSLYEQPPGRKFDVLVTTIYGCTAAGEVEIPTDINSFNGISPNGDGQNDSWEIACITLFPNNNVKIFNRNGIKVYEADGYNNQDISFDGIGKLGAYLIGEDLPDGTYFYIIDKRDGNPPIRGFLELLR
jgi:gliding motility-associated-like protein